MGKLHRPKREVFDIAQKVNKDPKGNLRKVDEYRVERFGIYLARQTPNHPHCHYLESWLLPELGIRVTKWWRKPGHHLGYDFYIDMAEITQTAQDVWQTLDLYLDITLCDGQSLEVLDADELIEASNAKLITPQQACRSLEICHKTIEKLVLNAYDLHRWLSGEGMGLSWRKSD
jgi:hypothetical protein